MPGSRKVALVTGAARGIGAAISRRLSADGFDVVLNYARSEKAAEVLAQEIVRAGGRAGIVQADVGVTADVLRMFDYACSAFGGVDALICNAGVMRLSSIEKTDDALLDEVIDVNLKGAFKVMRAGAQHVRKGGRIVSLSSSVVGLNMPSYGAYAATKAGLEALTRVLAKELRGRNITVNTIAPGPTATKLFLEGKSPEQIKTLSAMSPLERLGEPNDIANVASFLVGPEGAWINGQILRANGGMI